MAFTHSLPHPIVWYLDSFVSAFVPLNGPLVVSFTGSGGKTTTLRNLATYWANLGMSVLVSTTTRMLNPSYHDYSFDHVCIVEGDQQDIPKPVKGCVTIYGREDGKKISPVGGKLLSQAMRPFDRVLLESDGARGLPLKIHAERDPVIDAATNVVVALMGLSALDRPLDDRVMFLSDRFRQLTGSISDTVDESIYLALLEHPEGVFKRCGGLPVVVCCNQSDVVGADRTRQVLRYVAEHWHGRSFTCIGCSLHDGSVCGEEVVVEPNGSQRRLW